MRKNITLYGVMILAASLLVSVGCRRKESVERKKERDWRTLITSGVEKERMSARQRVMSNRRETIQYLLSVLNSPVEEGEQFYASTTSRNIAIFLLGRLRAKEAVTDLIPWLTPKPRQGLFVSEERVFSPAGEALVEIGLPSVPVVVKLLGSEGPISFKQECIKVIVGIKGLRETEFLFEDIIAAEADSAKRENLKAADDLLKDPKFRKILENIENRGI